MSTRTPAEEIARVDAELRAMWAAPRTIGQAPRTRAITMNLVVVGGAPTTAEQWLPIVDEVLLALPARALVIGLDAASGDGLEARATAVCAPMHGGDRRALLCAERVHLLVRGRLCARLGSVVGALCATDVPTTLVWLGHVHADDPSFAPLASEADRIVLDADQGSLASLTHAFQWARGRPEADRPGIADLAWTRLAPWQELCARMFDEPRLRPLASRVTGVTLWQASSPGTALAPEGALMLGWLATRLGWRASSLAGALRLVRSDGELVGTTLRARPECEGDGGCNCSSPEGHAPLVGLALEASDGALSMRGEVTRELKSADAVTWLVEVNERTETQRTARHVRHVRLRTGERARLLDRTLHRPRTDPALSETAAWADGLRDEELACE